MFRRILYTITIHLGLLSSVGFAQNKIELFADLEGNDTLQKLVTVFTDQLKKSVENSFLIKPANSYTGKGIYLGSTTGGNNQVKPSAELVKSGVEAFTVTVDDYSVQILGNSNKALGHGIFSYLNFLGYRFYFANPDWHIVPVKPDLFKKWKTLSVPSFDHRLIWYGYGTGSPLADADYNFWILANKMGGSVNPSFGHAYEEIISRNREVFLNHPEWFYPMVSKGIIPAYDAKFDMTHEDLVQFIIKDVEKRIQNSYAKRTNDYKMISLSPSDGIGTCNTPACQQLGNITDRVYYLVNRVAKAIHPKYPATKIGCLAYGEYIAPPTQKIESNVFVGITTAFNTSKYSTEQLVDEWRKKGAQVGIYDYFSWYAWDYDIPGQSLASRPDDLLKSVKKYYAKGVRAYEAESSIGWVSKGLGYYLAAKQMWDIKADAASARKEFFTLCFDNAADIMQQLWSEWESYSFGTVREGDLAKWIDYVTAAESKVQNSGVKKRLYQVKSYLHFMFLYRNYQSSKTEAPFMPYLILATVN